MTQPLFFLSRAVILAIALLYFSHADAAHLTSAPWAADAAQPDTCTAHSRTSDTDIPLTLIEAAPGSKALRHDVSALRGPQDWDIVCRNAWGESPTVNFTFAAGAPAAPAGLTIVE